MKRILKTTTFTALLCWFTIAISFAQSITPAEENAQVTLTVTKFRTLYDLVADKKSYTDATMSLQPHAVVTQVDRDGMPTLVFKKPAKIELTISSTDGQKYKALGIYFRQHPAATGDLDGSINFERWFTSGGNLAFRHRFIHKGPNGRWEFFIIIQRLSDGAIGVIDPSIETDSSEN